VWNKNNPIPGKNRCIDWNNSIFIKVDFFNIDQKYVKISIKVVSGIEFEFKQEKN